MSQPQTKSYTTAKGGIAALTHSLAVSFAGKVRVNSISPGCIDTDYTVYEGLDAAQQPAGRVRIHWILPMLSCFFPQKKQALSQEKTFASTVV